MSALSAPRILALDPWNDRSCRASFASVRPRRRARCAERVVLRRKVVKVAGREVSGFQRPEGRLLDAAALEGVGAAGVEAAALGRVDRARHVALQANALAAG